MIDLSLRYTGSTGSKVGMYSWHEGLLAAQYLIPTNLSEVTDSHVDANEAYYGDCFTSVDEVSLRPEVGKWIKSYEHVQQETLKPSSANIVLGECSRQVFRALHKILVIFADNSPCFIKTCHKAI